nr:MAG TPA: hypothetical protein [Bacteriophage sp.]
MLTDLSSISPVDLSGLFKVAPFNPMDTLTESSNNMMAQLQASSATRSQLDNLRGSIATQVANADLTAMKGYATDVISHTQDMFVTGFTSPALTQITPTGVTNPLSSDLLGGLTGELTGSSLTDGLFNEGKDLFGADGLSSLGDGAEGFLNSGLGDLAVTGAGLYISSLTGGAIPPELASAAVGTAADVGLGIIQGETPSLSEVGTNFAGRAASSYTGGLLGGSGLTGSLGGSSLTSSLASGINGMSLGSNSMTSILGETTTSSLFADMSGGTFEGLTDTVISNVGTSIASAASGNSSYDFNNIAKAATSFTKSIDGDVLGSVGGVNLTDTESLMDGIVVKGLDAAKSSGDVATFSDLLTKFSKDKSIFVSDVIGMSENIINNPYNYNNYTTLLDEVGVDVSTVISSGASYGYDAVREQNSKSLDISDAVNDRVSSLMNGAFDMKLYNKLTNAGDHLAKKVLDDKTYRQLNALKDAVDVTFSKNGSSNSYNSGKRSNRSLSRATEQIFNNGRSFGDNIGTQRRFDSNFTKAIDEARHLLY